MYNNYEFHYAPNGFLRKDDFGVLIGACKTIGEAIFDTPSSGATYDGVDYVPADLIASPEKIKEALKILNAYFGGIE